MGVFQFRVKGLDCGDEAAVLRRVLGPLVGGGDRLAFDIVSGKMTVRDPEVSAEAIRAAVAETGMEALPWAPLPDMRRESPRERLARMAPCLSSAAFAAIGYGLHAAAFGGVLAPLAGGAPPPPSAVIAYAGAVASGYVNVAPRALASIRALRPDMNLLMTAAVAGAMLLGDWLEAASVAFLFSLALLLESWSVGRARHAIGALLDLSPPVARTIGDDGAAAEVPCDAVAVGAMIEVRPGERFPLDGEITAGDTTVDQAPITGESAPVVKRCGDGVFAGTVNGEGAVEVRVTRPASDSTLARIIRLVEEAQGRRAPSDLWVERFARVYTPVMMGLAVAVALIPPLLFGGAFGVWFYQALVLLVISCPCALVISTPVSIVSGLARAAREGVLIRGGAHLETPARIRVVAFDKTGTLTWGKPVVERVILLGATTEAELLAHAAALEASSSHPLARAVIERAEAAGVASMRAEGHIALSGMGAQAMIGGHLWWIGSRRMLSRLMGENHPSRGLAAELEDTGRSVLAVGDEEDVRGLLSVADQPRPEAPAAVAALRRLGVARVIMLTGDNRRTAEAVAEATGVDEAHPELLPEDKIAAVGELARAFGAVAMVGDGVNDAPALAASSLGIAMGAHGTDAAIEAADISLMTDDLSRIPWLFAHSRRTLRIIRQNIAFALGVKAAFVVLVILDAANLWTAIAADTGLSLLVTGNALRLLGKGRSKV